MIMRAERELEVTLQGQAKDLGNTVHISIIISARAAMDRLKSIKLLKQYIHRTFLTLCSVTSSVMILPAHRNHG